MHNAVPFNGNFFVETYCLAIVIENDTMYVIRKFCMNALLGQFKECEFIIFLNFRVDRGDFVEVFFPKNFNFRYLNFNFFEF